VDIRAGSWIRERIAGWSKMEKTDTFYTLTVFSQTASGNA